MTLKTPSPDEASHDQTTQYCTSMSFIAPSTTRQLNDTGTGYLKQSSGVDYDIITCESTASDYIFIYIYITDNKSSQSHTLCSYF